MTGEEHVKENGDVVWRVDYFDNEMTQYTLAVLTREQFIIAHYTKPPKAILGWNRARRDCDYVDALGSEAVRINLADITRVEYGADFRDLLCMSVFWMNDRESGHQALEAPGDLEVFYRLREQIAPQAKIRKRQATIGSRILKPVVGICLTLLMGSCCCCGLTFIPALSGSSANPTQPKSRGEAPWALAIQLGPVGISVVVLLILVALLIWTILRLRDRGIIRYFDVPRPDVLAN